MLHFTRQKFLPREIPLQVTLGRGFHGDHECHSHAFWETVIVWEGSAEHTLAGHVREIRAGSILTVLPEESHSYRAARRFRLTNILYDLPALVPNLHFARDIPHFRSLIPTSPQDRDSGVELTLRLDAVESVRERVEELHSVLRSKEPGHLLHAQGRFMELLIVLGSSSEASSPGKPGRINPIAERVRQRIERDYSLPLSIEVLMENNACSRPTLFKVFREATGQTPMDYLIDLRLRHACNLLKSTPLPVAEIALSVGFSDSNYFSRTFRQRLRQTPTEFRRRVLGAVGG